jgi:hypothetical protein
MDNQAILDAVKAIEEQLGAIKTALGADNQDQSQGNPMVTPEKPSMMAGLQLGK